MNTVMVAFLLVALMAPAIAQNNFRPSPKKDARSEANKNCAGGTHQHQYSDLRVAMIRIRDVDDCGLSYVDLEDNTTGLDHRFEFSDDFLASRAEDEGSESKTFRVNRLTRDKVKRDQQGLAFYCAYCKVIMSLKL
jgi:hypothetical protein